MVFGACGFWRLWFLALVVFGAIECLQFLIVLVTRKSRFYSEIFLSECARPEESDRVQQLERALGKLTLENEHLRRKLISYDILTRENLELRKSAEEVNILRYVSILQRIFAVITGSFNFESSHKREVSWRLER